MNRVLIFVQSHITLFIFLFLFFYISKNIVWSFSGYGHVTPLSKEGKVFCIVYAMVGIPLTLVLMSALVERLMIPTTMFLRYLNSKLGHLYQVSQT